MTTEGPVLHVQDVVVERGDRRILDGLSFEVQPEARVLIRGESGAGKTTLFQLLGLLATPDQGDVYVNGENASNLSERDRSRVRREKIGLVFQDFQLVPDLTAWENAALPQQHDSTSTDVRSLQSLFDDLGISGRSEQHPASLSGGEKQRVAIARALSNKPSVVVADEPTGQLDPQSSQRVLELLHSVHQETGTALIVISHDRSIGDSFQNVIGLEDGSLIGI